ncbi:MAG: GNAT family N-acetyltransferase [Gemmatimonadaceae bacterium]|nr:GNAT family N-acetyltransferase [Gloeobacterales cyanobacterium ES-bin-141]
MEAGYLEAPEETWQLRNGTPVLLRPLCSGDLSLHWQLFRDCSKRSIHQRFFQIPDCSKVTDQDVERYTSFDRAREFAITAVCHPGGAPELGVVRLVHTGRGMAEFAVLVADPWQQQGLGRKLLEKAITTALHSHMHRLQGYVMGDNRPMLTLCRRLGFDIHYLAGEGLYQVHLSLSSRGQLST